MTLHKKMADINTKFRLSKGFIGLTKLFALKGMLKKILHECKVWIDNSVPGSQIDLYLRRRDKVCIP